MSIKKLVSILYLYFFAFLISNHVAFGQGAQRPAQLRGNVKSGDRGSELWVTDTVTSDQVNTLKTFALNYTYSGQQSVPDFLLRRHWREFESDSVPGKYNFALVDKAIIKCLDNHAKLNLQLFVLESKDQTQWAGKKYENAYLGYPIYVHKQLQASSTPDFKISYPLAKKNATIIVGRSLQKPCVVWYPNYYSDFLFQRYDALLAALAQHLNEEITYNGRKILRKNVVRVIQMRYFSTYGEGTDHQLPAEYQVRDPEKLKKYISSYIHHFSGYFLQHPSHTRFVKELLPALDYALSFKQVGWYYDVWGSDVNFSTEMKKYGPRIDSLFLNKWKSAPVGGEFGGDLNFPQFAEPFAKQVKDARPNVITYANIGYKSVIKNPLAMASIKDGYTEIGYQYEIASQQVSYSSSNADIKLVWKNSGVTHTYNNWVIKYFIIDKNGQTIWTDVSKTDLRTIFPQDIKESYTCVDSYKSVPKGRLYLEIDDKDQIYNPLVLNNKGRDEQGRYFIQELK